MRKLACWLLLALPACEGNSSVVGETRHDPLPRSEGPDDSGTTFQWLERIHLQDPTLCLPQEVTLPVTNGDPTCVVAEVMVSPGSCSCDQPGRQPVREALRDAIVNSMLVESRCDAETCADMCICEVALAEGAGRVACETDPDTDTVNGWCYLDPAAGLGAPELLADCHLGQTRKLRAVGAAAPSSSDAFHYLACQGTERRTAPGTLGEACIPTDEYDPTWSGFAAPQAAAETGSTACDSGVCLVNFFQGRASCPYGQTEEQAMTSPACFIPNSTQPVLVPVAPQLLGRPAETSSVCSCRCDGPGPGPFCECPESMECSPVFVDLGISGGVDIAGSYCTPRGTEYSYIDRAGPVCDRALNNCED